MKHFTLFLNQFINKVSWEEFQDIIHSVSLETINFSKREKSSIFIKNLDGNIAESLKLLFGKRGIILDFYKLSDNTDLIDFLNKKMTYKSTVDQTSRDNIFLTLYEPIRHKGISKIELISEKELNPDNLSTELIEGVEVYIDLLKEK